MDFGRPIHILIADDLDANRRLLSEICKLLSYESTAVADGQQVLDILEKQDFDLILLDMRMPI